MFFRKLAIALLSLSLAAFAQQPAEHPHDMTMPMPAAPAQQPQPTAPAQDKADMGGMQMDGSDSIDAEELNFSSGTGWSPRSQPEYMWMTKFRQWQLMAHGSLFLTFNKPTGPRGAGKFESMNWLMFMEERKLGRGTLQFRQMLSAESLTSPHPGFPQLFQTGETYKGAPLIDHQHPHDVFGELSARYVLPLGEHVAWSLYGGLAGEPALGPVTFMHRVSGWDIPAAPLGHHQQDSTHISFGVVTTGLIVGKVKVEGSAFNGREPDERRYNFDFAPMDSFSGRVSFAPSANWTMQYSYGHLRHPEALEATNINRQTASIEYNRPLANGNWASTLLWGRNEKTTEKTTQNSYLAESTLNFAARNYAYTRLELVDKDELGLPGHLTYRIGGYTFGGMRDLVQNAKTQIALGADLTFYSKPDALSPIYGEHPVAVKVFLRFRPGRMQH